MKSFAPTSSSRPTLSIAERAICGMRRLILPDPLPFVSTVWGPGVVGIVPTYSRSDIRVADGIKNLSRGRIDWLIVSGRDLTEKDAWSLLKSTRDRHPEKDIRDAEEIYPRISIDAAAVDTANNAIGVAGLYMGIAEKNPVRAVVIITSKAHQARAAYEIGCELKKALKTVPPMYGWTVNDEYKGVSAEAVETLKCFATSVLGVRRLKRQPQPKPAGSAPAI